MAGIIVPVTLEDRVAVAKAIEELNSIQHIRYMSRAMLLNSAGVKDTKLRAILQRMVDAGEITQYQLTDTKKPRYYYTLTEKGRELLGAQKK